MTRGPSRRLALVLAIVLPLAAGGCGGDDGGEPLAIPLEFQPYDPGSEGPSPVEMPDPLVGVCFDEPPNLAEVFSMGPADGQACTSSSFQVFTSVQTTNGGNWPGAGDKELTEDEVIENANAAIDACRRVLSETYGALDAQALAIAAPPVRSDWERNQGASLCLSKPPVM